MGLKTNIRKFIAAFRPDASLLPAIELMKINEFHRARQTFDSILKNSKSEKSKKIAMAGTASSHLSFHNCSAEANSDAIKTLNQATEGFPDEEQFWLALGDAWLDVKAEQFGEGNFCKKAYQKVIQLNQKSSDAYYGLGMVFQNLKDYKEAKICFERAIEYHPGHATAAFRLWMLSNCDNNLKKYVYDQYSKQECLTLLDFKTKLREKVTNSEKATIRKTQKMGTVIFRGGISPETIDELKKETVKFATKYEFKKNTSIPFEDAPSELKKNIDDVIQNQIFKNILPIVSSSAEKGWASMPNPAKWVQYFPPKTGRATPFHLDHPVVCQESDWTTFWVALTDAGPGIAPSLGVCKIPLPEPLDCIEQNIGRINSVPIDKIMEFFGDAMHRPTFKPGDVACFGRYMLHCTAFDNAMKQERLSFDFRYVTGPARFMQFLN